MGRVSYIRISLLFLFPVKDGKLSTGVNAIMQHLMHHDIVTVSFQQSKITLQNNCINNSITQPTLSFYL